MSYRVAGRVAAASFVALSLGIGASPAQAQKIANSYICVFKNDRVAKNEVNDRANSAARAHGGAVSQIYSHAIRGFSANISEAGMNAMRRNNPSIAYCEQDQVMTAIPVTMQGQPVTAQAETTPWGIPRVNGGLNGVGKVAWIIDSGIQTTHPDLNVAASRGAYFAGRSVEDENGHGTHVAGTIGAKGGNGIGVIGVAAGATVIPVRVLDRRGSGTTSGVIKGVDFVAANGKPGEVANMSLGGGVSTTLDNAVVNAAKGGVVFSLAAGNETDHANNHSPARANGANVYTISAFDSAGRLASFSNHGNPPIDYSEPGVSIYSTYKGSSYATLSGTSMAAPHFAGIMLLGPVRSGGTITGDRDSTPDTIGVH
jgi:hypothetical protein